MKIVFPKKINEIPRGFLVIAVLRAIRGVIAFILFGILIYISQNIDILGLNKSEMVASLAKKDSIFRFIFDWFATLSRVEILGLAMIAFMFGVIRWIEAFGILIGKTWAKLLALASAVIYLPFELMDLTQNITFPSLMILGINLLVIAYIVRSLNLIPVGK